MVTKYAPFTSTEAIKRAKAWVGKSYPAGWCQAWTVGVFGTGGVGDYDGDRAADAEDGWKKAVANGTVVKASAIKDLNSIPAGLMVYWTGGSGDFGHAAVSAGNGYIYSTDLPTHGKVGRVSIHEPNRRWGHTFVGYVTEEGNGYTLTDKPAPLPSTPTNPKVEPVSGVNFANIKGGDNAGKKSMAKRAPKIAKKAAKGHRHVVGFIECPKDSLPGLATPYDLMVRAMAVYDYRPISYGSSAVTFARPNVKHIAHENQILKTQNKGRKEAALHTAYQPRGERIQVLTLHHADVYATDKQRNKAFAEVRIGSSKFAKKHGGWQRDRRIAMDHNSPSGSAVKYMKSRGWKVAVSTRRDAIFYRPLTLLYKAWATAIDSDHPMLSAVFGKKK